MNKTELLNEAKKAKSLEELTQMAAAAGIPLTEEEAKFYFTLVNEKGDELSLDELDTVAGGLGNLFPGTGTVSCSNWQCNRCKKTADCCTCGSYYMCENCVHYTSGKKGDKCPSFKYAGNSIGVCG